MGAKSKRINVHVVAEDVPILERFKASGGNVSELLRIELHRWDKLEGMKGSDELIELQLSDGIVKAFFGTWIWRDETLEPYYGDIGLIRTRIGRTGKTFKKIEGVARTRKGRFLHYWAHPEVKEPSGWYAIYDSINDIKEFSARSRTEKVLADTAAPGFMDI